MQRDNWSCRFCKDEKNQLHVHHIEYSLGADPWEYPNEKLITLCEHCHEAYECIKDYPFIKNIPLSKVCSYKITHNDGSISLFIASGEFIAIAIFNKDGKFGVMRGFVPEHHANIIKLFKKAIK